MTKKNLQFEYVTDKELLDKVIIYLINLCPFLPVPRLNDHCRGVIASLFELVYYLDSHKLTDYGNNKK